MSILKDRCPSRAAHVVVFVDVTCLLRHSQEIYHFKLTDFPRFLEEAAIHPAPNDSYGPVQCNCQIIRATENTVSCYFITNNTSRHRFAISGQRD